VTLVSIGIPLYNAERYLQGALEALVRQTHQDLEIIISDNASTDRTQAICEAFAARDPRIRYIRQPFNRGAAYNHNFVAHIATGEYFRWYAYDDLMGPECIAECARTLDESADVVLAWPRPSVINGSGTLVDDFRVDLPWDDRTPSSRLRSRVTPDDSQVGWCFPIYGLARRDAFLKCLPMGAYNRSDTVLLAHLALLGRWRELPQGLFFCRVHEDNSTARTPPHEVARWMDPNASAPRSLPTCRGYFGLVRAVWRTPLSATENLRCSAIVARWPFVHRHARLMLWDVRVVAKDIVGLGREGWSRSSSQVQPSS
jgi:glycosyltransferase involved in cell wall biosynthesis